MPGLNQYWAKYGCEKCDTYKLLVLSVNFSNSKSDFRSWISQYNCTHPGVAKEEGGKEFNTILSNNNYGGPKYLIKPDKTFVKRPSSSQINSAGGNVQHVCGTSISTDLRKKVKTNVSIINISKNSFTLKTLKNDIYSISFYSANGKLKTTLTKKLSVGSHQISLKEGALANGVYIVEFKNSQSISRGKVVLD